MKAVAKVLQRQLCSIALFGSVRLDRVSASMAQLAFKSHQTVDLDAEQLNQKHFALTTNRRIISLLWELFVIHTVFLS